jgi:hypothetical protein
MIAGLLVGLVLPILPIHLPIQAQSAKNEPATIHVYRPKHMVGMALKPSIYCDGTELARLHNGKFFVSDIEPGKHVITAGRSEVALFIDLQPGGNYYFRLDHKNWAGTAVSGRQPVYLSQVAAGEAELEIKKLSQQDLTTQRIKGPDQAGNSPTKLH